MQLNRILETAARLGIPVVITNDRGESPQVVMPFEDFAAMAGVQGAGSLDSARDRLRGQGTGDRTQTRRHEAEEEIAETLANLTAERLAEEARETARHYHADKGSEATDRSFLEEKFYLEPLEDEEKD
jgi:hypothetical protein